jgi:electron transfer flavoprotein alpha subunit
MIKTLIYFDANLKSTIDLLEVVNQIFKDIINETYAISINESYAGVNGEFDYWINVKDETIKSQDIINITNCIEELNLIYDFDCILIPATYIGRMLAPRLAMRLQVGLIADVTSINHFEGKVGLVRPAFDGKILAGIVSKNNKPLMASIQENVFTYIPTLKKTTKEIDFKPEKTQISGVTLLETREKETSQDIRDSEVLVSGGGGVGEQFEQIKPLAIELNGMVSASRRIVDSGIATRNIQVGQSGKIVSPKLYIALGIYGSLQHIEGLKNVEYIISVNVNKNAPICSLSDIVVEGDAVEFVEKLVSRIKWDK